MKHPLILLFLVIISILPLPAFSAVNFPTIEELSSYSYLLIPLIVTLIGIIIYVFFSRLERRKSSIDANVLVKKKIIAASGSCLLRINKKLIVESANEKAQKMIGLPLDLIVGQALDGLIKHQRFSNMDGDSIFEMVKKQFQVADFGLNYIDASSEKKGVSNSLHMSTAPITNHRNKVVSVALIGKDLSTHQKVLDQLIGKAEKDHLTGLVNRMGFDKYIEQFPNNSRPNNKNVLCFMDLDNFKPVNDGAGHAAGDELLKQLSDIFRQHVRSTDLLARTGGDEFVILFPNCTMEKAKVRCNNIINSVSSLRFSWGEKSFIVGVSMGAVEFNSGVTVEGLKNLCKVADDACYMAKKKGRNQLFIHNSGRAVQAKSTEFGRDNWQDIIRDALKNHRFILMAQPIVPLGNQDRGERKRFEIFIRLPYNGRVLRPGSFFPAAERYGLSLLIDRWVVHTTFQRISMMNLNSLSTGVNEFTINLTTASLLDETFSTFVSEELDLFAISASLICFEISESTVISNFSQARKLLAKLATIGCKNSLDDFGSGLSALNYIRDLPLHYLKIDGVFVKNIEKNQVDAAMIHSLNHMSKVMNLKTIAEFVEDEHTAKLLYRLGVNYAQGYYCGHPMLLERLGEISEVASKELPPI